MSIPFEEIYKLEEHLEAGFMQILQPCTEFVYSSRDPQTLKSPRLEVKAVSGGVYDKHAHVFMPGQDQMYDTWEGQMFITVVTNRTTDIPTNIHTQLIGKMRYRMTLPMVRRAWANDIVIITDVREQGTEDSFVDANDIDITVISFYTLFNINTSGVWPDAIS